MEHLSLHDREQGPSNAASAGQSQQGALQLPPQMFTTAAQLLDLTDKKLLLVLRDGRKLIGVLRSWDQFANLVLQDTIERLFVRDLYADIPRGVFLIRGENVLMLGEIVRALLKQPEPNFLADAHGDTDAAIPFPQDLDKDDYIPASFHQASIEEVFALQKQEDAQRKKGDKVKKRILQDLGFEAEHSGEVLFG